MQQDAGPRKTVADESIPLSALLSLLAANVALASGPLFVRLADTGPVAAAFWRLALATPVLVVAGLLIQPGAARTGMRLIVPLMLAGLAFAGDLASWHLGIVRTTLANATLFGNSATLIFPIYGFLVARAWPNRSQALALALAAIGAALLLGRSAELSSRNLAGDLLSLLAGTLYAVYFIAMARARLRLSALPALAFSSAATLLPLLLLATALGERIVPGNWTPLVMLALSSQLIGQGLMIHALGRVPPIMVGIALLTQPVIAAGIGWAVYAERPGMLDALGGLLVAAALVLVRRGARPPLARPNASATPR